MKRALAVAMALATAACSTSPDGSDRGSPTSEAARTGPPPVYVAVGASETAGIGAEVPLRDGWPRVLFRTAMPENTVFVNMGIPGATVAQALQREVPSALALNPHVVTVWLNVNDIIADVTAVDFERDLGTLVRHLRRNGSTRVLVANSPPIDHLPSYKACRPDPPATAPPCRSPGGVELPPPEAVNALVDEYNVATARIAEREGAALVDLHATGMSARSAGIAEALVSPDGFHPNTGGHQAVATAFADVLRKMGPL